MSAVPGPVRIRAVRPYDAAALLELKHQLLAELGDQLVGYVQLTGGSLRRSRATAYVMIGVLAHAAGRGTGTELLRQARAGAAASGLHRLELTVMAHNTRAIRLYERMGFSVEGRHSECLLVDGQFIDELTMATLLPAIPLSLARHPLIPRPPPPLAPGGPSRSARWAPGYVLGYLVGHRARNWGRTAALPSTRHTAPLRLVERPAWDPPVRLRPGRRPALAPFMKTVNESRHRSFTDF